MDKKPTTFVFDIDGTICTNTNGAYELAIPIEERIGVVNRLYDEGATIILNTARGMGTFMNDRSLAELKWADFTKEQLSRWGIRYHALFFGKPAGDLYIDDKALRDLDFFKSSFFTQQ
jgi:hypothetical protein